jgi:hypothetical protein
MQLAELHIQKVVLHMHLIGLQCNSSSCTCKTGGCTGRERTGKLLDEIREKQLADELKNSRQAKAWVKRMLAK